MKKTFSKLLKAVTGGLLIAVVSVASIIPTFAGPAEANLIFSTLNEDINVNGTIVRLPDKNLSDAQNWLQLNNNIITSEQAAVTVAAIKQAQDYVASQGILTIESANRTQKTRLLQLGNQAGNGLGLKVAFNAASDTIYVEDSSQQVLSTYKMGSSNTTSGIKTSTGSTVTNYTDTTNPIKQTGINTTNFWIITGIFVALGTGAFFVGKRFHIMKK